MTIIWANKIFFYISETSKVWIMPGCQLLKGWGWTGIRRKPWNNVIISVNSRWAVSESTVHSCTDPGEDSHLSMVWWPSLCIHWVLPSGSWSVSEICSLKRLWTCRNIFAAREFIICYIWPVFFSSFPSFFRIFPHPLPLTVNCPPSTSHHQGLILIGRFL